MIQLAADERKDSMSCWAPILVFTYNRLEETKRALGALQNNYGANLSQLYIFSDGPKDAQTSAKVDSVRKFLKTITGFQSVEIIERRTNYGLAGSIIDGVSELIEKFGRVIVVEDDLVTSQNFLLYMNQALDSYQLDERIWSVSGFSFPINYSLIYPFDAAFGIRASSWGWATWQNRWKKVEWDVSNYASFTQNKNARRAFNRGGSDMCKMLHDQMTGKINSWAIRFCYAQFRNGAFDVFPRISKVKSIGFDNAATHTRGMDGRFATNLDSGEKRCFVFPEDVHVDEDILCQFIKPYSILTRLKYKFANFIP